MRRLAVVCAAAWLVPGVLEAQGRDGFVRALVDFSNAMAGTHGDEGPALLAALDGMEAGLGAWDALVTSVEAKFAQAVASASPPEAARMRAALGTVYLERGRLADAVEQFDRAAALDPAFAEVQVPRGLAYELLDRPGDAAGAYRALWERDGSNPAHAYLFVRSSLQLDAVVDATAMSALQAAAEHATAGSGPLFATARLMDDGSLSAPLYPPAVYTDAFALLRSGQFAEAVSALRAAVQSDPLVTDSGVKDAAVREAVARLRNGDRPAALAALLDAASRADSTEIRRILGIAYREGGQYEESLAQLRLAVSLDPANERARLAMADVLAASGNPAAARDVLAEAAAIAPRSGLVQWNLGLLAQRLGDEEGALRAFQAAAALPALAGERHVHAAIGRLFHNRLDLDEAASAYERRLAAAPNDRAAHYDLGEIYRLQGRLDAALAEFLVAALLDPPDARAFAKAGQIHAAAGRDADAVRLLRRATELDGGHLEARYALSRALLRLGRTEEAQRELAMFEQLQAKAMAEERRRYEENQRKLEEALRSGQPQGAAR